MDNNDLSMQVQCIILYRPRLKWVRLLPNEFIDLFWYSQYKNIMTLFCMVM